MFAGPEAEARQAICDVGRDLYASALIGGRAGNLSVRLDADRLLVTPAGAHKGRLEPDDPVVVRLASSDPGDRTSGTEPGDGASRPGTGERATSELPSHRAVYAARPDVDAVVHTHAPALTAAGLRGIDVTAPFPEIREAMGAVGRVPFRPSGSEELAAAVGDACRGADVLLLERHGVLAVGATLDEARDRTELAELTAWAAIMAEDGGLELDLRRVAELHRRVVERREG